MNRPPLARIEELFHRAADLEPGARAAFLDSECAGDGDLRTAIEELLRHDEAADRTEAFIVSPIDRAPADSRDSKTSPASIDEPGLPAHAPPGYELIEVLGSGGMGVVIKARQVSLNRIVALKMLLSAAAIRPEQLARFCREAETLAQLQHPNIVQLFEVGQHEGRPYLVMEYVPGPNLAEEINGTPQPAKSAAALVTALARAIQAVHERGIIHRDLKPANILLVSGGVVSGGSSGSTHRSPLTTHQPKITDFGLAKRLNADSNQTSPGSILGTPSYMAPEQARGRSNVLGPATDIYALGAILYELLTGRPPFRGTSAEETVTQLVLEEPISPDRLRPALPRDLVTICLKCLEKEPPKRYASAALLAEDLQRFMAGESIRARPIGTAERAWRWCRRRPAVAALAATSVLLAVALVSTIIIYQSLLLEQTEHKLHGAQKQAEEKGQIAEKERLQLSSLDRAQGAHELEEGDDFAALHWLIEALRWDVEHPDEERLDRIAIALTLQHCPQFVQSVSFDGMVAGVQMSDTACWVATVGKDNAIKVREVRTGRLRELQGAVQANDPVPKIAISPDGRFLALAPEAGGRDAVTNVWDLTTGRRHTPALHHGTTALRLVFSDDNDLLTMHLADGTVLVWELRTGKRLPSGASERVAVGHRAMSDNGRWLFTLSADGVERVHDLTRGKLAALPRKLDHTVVCAALSADGRRLAFSDTSDEVRIWDIESGAARLLRPSARGGALIRQIHWNADSRLLLTVDHLNRGRVWNAVTGTPVTPPLAHPGPVLSAGFSTDDMVVTIGSDGVVQVWRLPHTRAETLGIAIKILRGEVLDTREFTSDARPMRDLMALAETLSGRRMGARGALESVGGEQLRAIRKSLSNGDLPR